MPDVKRDEVGRRVFQLKQQQSVDGAMAIMRTAQGRKWNDISEEDVGSLRLMIEELWLEVDRETWKRYSFSRLTLNDILSIVRMGYSVKNGTLPKKEALNQLSEICGRTTSDA
ncbi:hypothetical protein FTO68_08670 [Methanocalculus taiwanensis]|uniref:Uncharacterized protein n=1 Tax=Methanocalculus taiwanensis TaxID=106207 RepID=A0ABD4TMH6_9EURY|nr:hypothetical protein [Methanocalculus taiwanensis]MCQ1539050.1 hypothetical protein [Methanocalculus taiwanensis]